VHVRGVAYKGTIEVSTRPRRSNGAGDGQVGQVTGSVR
jgi:hypothetical protein